jgi:hypothetical protein
LDSLKVSVTLLTSLLEQALKNAFGEGLSNIPAIFVENQATTKPEEITGERAQDPQHNLAFVQPTIPVPTPAIIYTFTNESHKTRSSNNIDQDKMATLEARIRAIEGVDLYDPVKTTKKCLVPNMVVPYNF